MSYDYEGNNQFPLAVTLPDDGDTPGQTTFAPGWEGNRDAAVYLLRRSAGPALYNFHTPTVATGTYGWASFVWDGQTSAGFTLYARWVAVQNETGGAGCRFMQSLDGKTWLTGASTSSTGAVVLANSLTISANIAAAFTGGSKVVYLNITSGGTSITTSAGWDATQGCAWDNRTTNKAYFLGATQSGGTFTGAAASFVVSGPTTVNLSGNLPAGWASGTNHVGNYRYATDGTTYVVLMCGVTPVTDTARLLNAGVIATPTDITPSVLANKIGIGIAWNAASMLWTLCTRDAANTYIYTSPDLIAWTLAKQITGYTNGKEFSVVSGVWLLVAGSYDGLTGTTVLYASSSNGVTWNRCQTYAQFTNIRFQPGDGSVVFGGDTTGGVAISNYMSLA